MTQFTEARLTLVGNGYIIGCINNQTGVEQQFVARDLDQACAVLQAVMVPPPEKPTVQVTAGSEPNT
jgi:hypothetical protein